MALTALKRQPAEELAAQALKESIIGGALKPGERLTEAALADQLAVSRGTIRSALHHLSSDGLVVLTPYTGWAVTTIGPHDLWEIFTLRGSLEGLAARLATERIDADGRDRLGDVRDAFFAACGRGDVAAAVEHDFALHRCIVALSGNGRLVNQYRLVEQQIRFFINSTYEAATDISVAIANHAPIVEAILAGRAIRAGRLGERHVRGEGERVLRLMRSDAD